MRTSRPRGVTLVELLVVVGIICLLLSLLVLTLGKLRERTRISHVRVLLSQVHAALEAYHLSMRKYPPQTFNGMTETQTLNYYLTTAFRKNPNTSAGEVYSDTNGGPFMTFDQQDLALPAANGLKTIIDPWGSPLRYTITWRDTPSVNTQMQNSKVAVPKLYSIGMNKIDDTEKGLTPNDDINPEQ